LPPDVGWHAERPHVGTAPFKRFATTPVRLRRRRDERARIGRSEPSPVGTRGGQDGQRRTQWNVVMRAPA
jgi:hypothetical protein